MDHTVIVNRGQRVLKIREGESLLVGLSRNGLILPTVCGGGGQCGFCRIRVEKGAGPLTPAETARLSSAELQSGIRLACQVRVTGETAVTVQDYLFEAGRFSAVTEEKTFLARDVVRLVLRPVQPSSMRFVPGQFILLRAGDPAVTRAYSMASSPSEEGKFSLIIKKVPHGSCSGWIADRLRPGDAVRFSGPYGDFRLSENSGPALFIAGGSGIAPLASMLLKLKEQGSSRAVILCFGASTRQDLFYMEEMCALEKALPGFRFVPVLSGEAPDSDWDGERGLVTEAAERRLKQEAFSEAYLCGPPGMVAAARRMLKANCMPEAAVFYDRFE